MDGNAKRAAAKFTLCALIAILAAVAIITGDGSGWWRACMYTAAAGVCCGVVWPSQDEGDALIKWMDNGRQ